MTSGEYYVNNGSGEFKDVAVASSINFPKHFKGCYRAFMNGNSRGKEWNVLNNDRSSSYFERNVQIYKYLGKVVYLICERWDLYTQLQGDFEAYGHKAFEMCKNTFDIL